MVYMMSGQVTMDVYMRDPMAWKYGTFFIGCFSLSEVGDSAFDRMALMSMGVFTLKPSCRLNLVMTESMYALCERVMVWLGLSHSMQIPSNHFTGPRSTMPKYFHKVSFTPAIANGELAVTGISST